MGVVVSRHHRHSPSLEYLHILRQYRHPPPDKTLVQQKTELTTKRANKDAWLAHSRSLAIQTHQVPCGAVTSKESIFLLSDRTVLTQQILEKKPTSQKSGLSATYTWVLLMRLFWTSVNCSLGQIKTFKPLLVLLPTHYQ